MSYLLESLSSHITSLLPLTALRNKKCDQVTADFADKMAIMGIVNSNTKGGEHVIRITYASGICLFI